MFPSFGETVVGLEAKELGARAGSVREVSFEEMPPFVGYGGRSEGEEVAGIEVIALLARADIVLERVSSRYDWDAWRR